MKYFLFNNSEKLFLNATDGYMDLASADEIDQSEYFPKFNFGTTTELWEVPQPLANKLAEIWGDYPEDMNEDERKYAQAWQDVFVSHNYPEYYSGPKTIKY